MFGALTDPRAISWDGGWNTNITYTLNWKIMARANTCTNLSKNVISAQPKSFHFVFTRCSQENMRGHRGTLPVHAL